METEGFSKKKMKTRLIVSLTIGVVVVGVLSVLVESYLSTKSFCESLEGELIDHNTCRIMESSPTPICDVGPVLESGYCYKNGMKILSSSLKD